MVCINKFIKIIKNAGYEATPYSGKIMYGRNCLPYIVNRGDLLFSVAKIVNSAQQMKENKVVEYCFQRSIVEDIDKYNIVVFFPYFEWRINLKKKNDLCK